VKAYKRRAYLSGLTTGINHESHLSKRIGKHSAPGPPEPAGTLAKQLMQV